MQPYVIIKIITLRVVLIQRHSYFMLVMLLNSVVILRGISNILSLHVSHSSLQSEANILRFHCSHSVIDDWISGQVNIMQFKSSYITARAVISFMSVSLLKQACPLPTSPSYITQQLTILWDNCYLSYRWHYCALLCKNWNRFEAKTVWCTLSWQLLGG